ncbi:uncharacterized protein [Palaemon carinicauda]|uniref:uncharacterized protein n=1 Tax=Palaemon carinicauda TaxID=392227 RepID=UPI0035B5FFD5
MQHPQNIYRGAVLTIANHPYSQTSSALSTTALKSTKYHWKFLFADIILPIVVADFLSHFHLLVDVGHRHCIHLTSQLSHYGSLAQLVSTSAHPRMCRPTSSHHTWTFSVQYIAKHKRFPPKNGIYHHIKTTGPTVFTRFTCLGPDCLAVARQMVAEMEEMDFCQKASSSWASPVYIISKKDGSLHLCGDYGCFNI